MARWSEAQVWIRHSFCHANQSRYSYDDYTLLTIFHVIVCIFLILVVLLQQGKGADWAGRFRRRRQLRRLSAPAAPQRCLSKATTAAAIHLHDYVAGADNLISRPGGRFRDSRRRETAAATATTATARRRRQQQPAARRRHRACDSAPRRKRSSSSLDVNLAEVVELADTPS